MRFNTPNSSSSSVNTPTLYYINHPLSKAESFSLEVLATFTDKELSDYEQEFEVYKKTLAIASSEAHALAQQLYDLTHVLFQDTRDNVECKQVKYILRNLRKGETVVDKHANSYPSPETVRGMVEDAKGIIARNSLEGGQSYSDEYLNQLYAATAFLEKAGYKLDEDFCTQSAPSFAMAIALDYLVKVKVEGIGIRPEMSIIVEDKWQNQSPLERFYVPHAIAKIKYAKFVDDKMIIPITEEGVLAGQVEGL